MQLSAAKTRFLSLAIGMTFVTSITPALFGDEWRQWRGPSGNNHAAENTEIPLRWNLESGTNIDWKIKLPGRGHSTPIVIDEGIFMTTSDPDAGTQSLLKVDGETGLIVDSWVLHRGTIPKRVHPNNSHASPSPAFDGDRVFVVFHTDGAIWVSAVTTKGRIDWQKKVCDFKPESFQFGYGASPIIEDGLVIIAAEYDGPDSGLYALDTTSGAQVWKVERPQNLNFASPIATDIAGQRQILLAGADMIAGYDPSTGRRLWKVDSSTEAICGTMVWDGRRVFVSGGNPVQAFPDQHRTIEALRSLDLLVVIDHRMTATAELADYVFAPRGQLERADVPNVMDRRFPAVYTNYTDAVIDSGDDVVNEWEVFAGIAARNGTPIDLPGGRLPIDDTELSDHDVIDHVFGAARFPVSEWRTHRQVIHDDPIRVVAADPDATGRFAVAPDDVVAELAEVRAETEGAVLLSDYDPERYPFRLIGRRLKHALNSLGNELPGLARVATTNHAYTHPLDMEALGVEAGDLLEITSQRGTVIGVAEPDPDLKRGVISMSHSWGGLSTTDEKVRDIGSPTNRLVDGADGTDRITGLPVMSAIPVSVRRTTDEELVSV